jgi:MFS family permease
MRPTRISSSSYRSKFHTGKLGVLGKRDFRRFYAGYSASLLGTAMSSVAIAFAVLGAGGTPTGLGVVFAANIVPMIAFTLGGGAIADRLGRRPVMLAADAARCAAQGVLAGVLYLGHPRLWLFVAAALAVGTGNAFFQPALAGLPVQLAPRDRLGDANALLAAVQPAAQVAGPALAGMLIAASGPATVVAVDAASYAASAVALALVRFPPVGRVRSRSLLADLADGWAEFRSRAWLWIDTVQFALFNLLTWGPYLVLGPVLAREYLGGARAWGAILASYGGGAILGGLLALGRRPRRPLLVATLANLGFPLPPLALALHLPAVDVAGGALLAGLGSALGGALWATVTQQQVPAPALSRVAAFNMVGAFAFGPVAFAAAGPVAAAVGPRAVLGFGAAWAVLGTLAVLAVPSVRRVTWLAGEPGQRPVEQPRLPGEDDPLPAVGQLTGRVQVAGMGGGLGDHVQDGPAQRTGREVTEEVGPPPGHGVDRRRGDDLVGPRDLVTVPAEDGRARHVRRDLPGLVA